MKTVSIGYYREDGDFTILATFNNSKGSFTETAFTQIVTRAMSAMEEASKGNLTMLERQDCVDYVFIDEQKPVVKYKPTEYDKIKLGINAFIFPMTHTSPFVSNNTHVFTSVVIRIGENGEFETKNSIYRPL
jgi:hypothetical protein